MQQKQILVKKNLLYFISLFFTKKKKNWNTNQINFFIFNIKIINSKNNPKILVPQSFNSLRTYWLVYLLKLIPYIRCEQKKYVLIGAPQIKKQAKVYDAVIVGSGAVEVWLHIL